MALRDEGYFLPAAGGTLVYTAPVDTPAPAPSALAAPSSPWAVLAHVGDETGDGNVDFTRDGGDITVKGSMSKKAIRTTTEAVTTGIEADFTQLSRETLALYHGTTGGSTTGVFEVSGTDDGSTNTAFLVVFSDGTNQVALYAPKVSWAARDNINFDSTEDATRVPMAATFLDSDTLTAANSKPLRYTWIAPELLSTES